MSAFSLGFIAGAIFGPGTLLIGSLFVYSLAEHVNSWIKRRRQYAAREKCPIAEPNGDSLAAGPRPWSLIKAGQIVHVFRVPSRTNHEELVSGRTESQVS
jgi:hypothetical protein